MTDLGWMLIAACVVLVLLPPKYDPAIRIKEWQIKKGEHPESPDRSDYACRHADDPDTVCGQCGRGCNR